MSTNDTSIHIKLSKTSKKYAGKYTAIVDEIDSDLSMFNWTVAAPNRQYVKRTIGGRKNRKGIWMHREIMERMLGYPVPDGLLVDHINGDKLDNRRENLRLATMSQNGMNRGKPKTNSSGYKGVYRHKQNERWVANIQVNGNTIYIGSFDTPEDAHAAYCAAADLYHKEFKNYGDK